MGLSPKRPKSRFQELHAANGNCVQDTNLSPQVCFFREATLAYFSCSPMLHIGPMRVWAVLAPWVLLLGWWSTELEIDSKRVLLSGEG